ncbi:hypothetical protein [Microbacterium sp. KR10-403]|uniref:hypothetical protein n=1 Tax=Microbacterium sp. KR10-403 TaxID=3158581 RepID=UPI0032E3CA78
MDGFTAEDPDVLIARVQDQVAAAQQRAQAASRDAGQQAVGLAAAAFGEDSPVVARLRDEVTARTGVPDEER